MARPPDERAPSLPEPTWEARVLVGPLAAPVQVRLTRALSPESSGPARGSRFGVRAVEGGTVELSMVTEGTPAIRAALNSHLRWVELALRVEELAEHARGRPASDHP
jgi:tRNA threonylcarbamoyladenosine modification (KEOPS) complex  Pcc1 subunit